VKGYKTKSATVKHPTKGTYSIEVLDESTLPHLVDEAGFHDYTNDFGFLLGCAKASALKLDDHEELFVALIGEIDELRSELGLPKKTLTQKLQSLFGGKAQ
jgi:hypothetical protein